MRELGRRIQEFLTGHGITGGSALILIGLLLLCWQLYDIRKWDELDAARRRFLVTGLLGSVVMLLGGLLIFTSG